MTLKEIMTAIFGYPASQETVNSILEEKSKQRQERLDWQHSIVDLLKLLKLDSSFAARQELARELNYPGDIHSDSAAMNVWLHQKVMERLEWTGGRTPREMT